MKIQEELDNLSRERDNAVSEGKKFEDETKKLSDAIY